MGYIFTNTKDIYIFTYNYISIRRFENYLFCEIKS